MCIARDHDRLWTGLACAGGQTPNPSGVRIGTTLSGSGFR